MSPGRKSPAPLFLNCRRVERLAIIVVLWALSAIPNIGSYAPMGILNWGNGLVLGEGSSAWSSLAISMGLAAAFGVGAWQALVRKEL